MKKFSFLLITLFIVFISSMYSQESHMLVQYSVNDQNLTNYYFPTIESNVSSKTQVLKINHFPNTKIYDRYVFTSLEPGNSSNRRYSVQFETGVNSNNPVSGSGSATLVPGDIVTWNIFATVNSMGIPVVIRSKPAPTPSMVPIPSGTFMMGSSDYSIDEKPQHRVTVRSYYMGKYPVTQKEYREIMGTNPSNFKGDYLPVEQVSWYDAVNYCNRLSLKEGLTPAYTVNGTKVTWNYNADGYRLPTEAEWEYACRARTTTPYYIGDSVANAAWYSDNSDGRTHPVGEKQANAWGLHDMLGNVFEWCWDWKKSYPIDTQPDQKDDPSNGRVVRGGCWEYSAQSLRFTIRTGHDPSVRWATNGFRIARNLEEATSR
jgi:formylglycine-generating enzyme